MPTTRKLNLRDTAQDRSGEIDRACVRARESQYSRYTITGPKEAVLDHCAHLIQKERRPSKKDPKVVRTDPSWLKEAGPDDEITITMRQNNWTGD